MSSATSSPATSASSSVRASSSSTFPLTPSQSVPSTMSSFNPQPTPGTGFGGGGNNGNNGNNGGFNNNGGNNGPGITSSASLYCRSLLPLSTSPSLIIGASSSLSPFLMTLTSQSLSPFSLPTHVRASMSDSSSTPLPSPPIVYTFLATLVLLLSVSAAIVIRSFILRRRHRAMIEEAIRNGTWVAPPLASMGGGRPKVDLSKKPKLYEAYLGEKGKSWEVVKEGGWEEIRPVMVAYVGKGDEGRDVGRDVVEGQAAVPPPIPLPLPQPHVESPLPPRRSFLSRITSALSPRSSSPTSPLPPPVTSSLPPAIPLPEIHTSSTEKQPEINDDTSESGQRVRVAVFIAMPSPAASHRRSMSLSLHSTPGASSSSDESEPLPHLEMGFAELPLGRQDEEAEMRAMERKGSMGSEASA
ncbi:hypothetical protein BDQ17DRAFT_1423152 [Cyathus striatus]|nr:hypothetical protein BDQ17DRAFT_1423152 [Cyathus striatus]